MIILDTDVLSALMREQPEAVVEGWLDRQPRELVWTTSITIMEISFGLATMPMGRRRARLEEDFEAMQRRTLEQRVLSFDVGAAQATAELMATRRQRGTPGALNDSMIAGIAVARHATLATRNTRHFADLPVTVVNPWED